MDTVLLAMSGAGLILTMIGMVALGVAGSRKLDERRTEERKLAAYRRRMLLGMLHSREPQAR